MWLPLKEMLRLTRLRGRESIVAFIRDQATKGTAYEERKLMKLADMIERGDHE